MFKKQLSKNIDSLDLQIGNALEVVANADDEIEREKALAKIEKLTELRVQLEDNRVSKSVKPAIISGLFGIASVALVLKYEETDVITSKAFSMATSMIRGSK